MRAARIFSTGVPICTLYPWSMTAIRSEHRSGPLTGPWVHKLFVMRQIFWMFLDPEFSSLRASSFVERGNRGSSSNKKFSVQSPNPCKGNPLFLAAREFPFISVSSKNRSSRLRQSGTNPLSVLNLSAWQFAFDQSRTSFQHGHMRKKLRKFWKTMQLRASRWQSLVHFNAH